MQTTQHARTYTPTHTHTHTHTLSILLYFSVCLSISLTRAGAGLCVCVCVCVCALRHLQLLLLDLTRGGPRIWRQVANLPRPWECSLGLQAPGRTPEFSLEAPESFPPQIILQPVPISSTAVELTPVGNWSTATETRTVCRTSHPRHSTPCWTDSRTETKKSYSSSTFSTTLSVLTQRIRPTMTGCVTVSARRCICAQLSMWTKMRGLGARMQCIQ